MNDLTVDRTHFAAYCQGILLRMERGQGIVVDERACVAAEEALDRGERVLLTEGGRLTGTCVRLVDGAYVEVVRDE